MVRSRLLDWCILTALVAAALFACARLAAWGTRFATDSLQMDFACYYVAGKSVSRDLSPYVNHAAHDPSLWDGRAQYQHSRFLYPPLVATLFVPLASLPYAVAKVVWMLISLACMGAACWMTARTFGLGARGALLAATGVALFHPLLAHLERGQIDAATLLLITSAFVLLSVPSPSRDRCGGALLAAATLVKLHCIYFLPFLLLQRRWRGIEGYAWGVLAILTFSVAVPPGASALTDYVSVQFPRIARAGPHDPGVPRADRKQLPLPSDDGSAGGGIADAYPQRSALRFLPNASLVPPLHNWLTQHGMMVPLALLSLGAFTALAIGMTATLRPWTAVTADPRREFLFWQLATVLVLLTAPLTWTMNVVWLLPLLVAVIAEASAAVRWRQALPMALAGAALLSAAVPDHLLVPMPAFAALFMPWKYIAAEALLMVALVCRLAVTRSEVRAPALRSASRLNDDLLERIPA